MVGSLELHIGSRPLFERREIQKNYRRYEKGGKPNDDAGPSIASRSLKKTRRFLTLAR